MEISDEVLDAIGALEKEGIEKHKEDLLKRVDGIVERAENGVVIMSEKEAQTLGTEWSVCAIIMSTIETIIENTKTKQMYIDGLKRLLERVEGEDE